MLQRQLRGAVRRIGNQHEGQAQSGRGLGVKVHNACALKDQVARGGVVQNLAERGSQVIDLGEGGS